MKADAVRGHLDGLLLAVLEQGPLHGYAIITAVQQRSGGVLELRTGTIYPALQRLERVGLLSSSWQSSGVRVMARRPATTTAGRPLEPLPTDENGLGRPVLPLAPPPLQRTRRRPVRDPPLQPSQTEAMRLDLQGPYLLASPTAATPSPALFAANHDPPGSTASASPAGSAPRACGRVAGVGLAGMDADHPYTVGFANAAAQYWTRATAGTGAFSCRGMLPGTYTLTVYKGELAVHTGTVTVTAGAATALHTLTLTNDPSAAPAIWRIGDWDGTPGGFKNATLMTYAHPADVRAASWTGNVVLGAGDVAASFPCYLWKDVNDGVLVYFRLTAAQAAAAHTLRIGVTTAFLNGRPQVTVNDWVSAIPSPPAQPSTRSLTNGSYRGNNHTFTYVVPASAWKTDPSQYNVLKLNVVSGSTGTGFLSAGTAFDCVDLLP
ncbi:hypothetical protein SNARM312S_03901 [Streptomyces narbonensis]